MKVNQRIFDKTQRDDFGKDKDMKKNFNNSMTSPNATVTDSTMIFEGMRFVGDISGSHDLYLNGAIEGSVDLSANLTIRRTGKFKGEIKAQKVMIEGEVEGKVVAEDIVELRDGAKLSGDTTAPSIMISDKAFFRGNFTKVTDEHTSSSHSKKGGYTKDSDKDKSLKSKIKVVDDLSTSSDQDDKSSKKSKMIDSFS